MSRSSPSTSLFILPMRAANSPPTTTANGLPLSSPHPQGHGGHENRLRPSADEEATIKACLDIYERWFVSKESQPEPIAHNTVAYRDVVVGQLSLIFTPPPPGILRDLEAGRRHALLCKQARTSCAASVGS